MSGFKSLQHTATPNDLFDEYMPLMGYAELKVVMFLCRETFGWHRPKASASIRDIANATGLSARRVQDGIDRAIERGLLSKHTNGNTETEWTLIIEDGVDVKSTRKSPLHDVKSTHTSNKERKDTSPANPNTKKIKDAFVEACGYPVNWRAGNGEAAKWLADNGYTPEQVVACYKHLKSQEFWEKKTLGLASITKQIGEFVKSHPSQEDDGIDYNKWGYNAKGQLVEIK